MISSLVKSISTFLALLGISISAAICSYTHAQQSTPVSLSPAPTSLDKTVEVLSVISGDMIEISDGVVIRLAGIDAYEPFNIGWVDKIVPSRRKIAEEALERIQQLTAGRQIRCEFPSEFSKDENFKWAYVFIEDQCLNKILLEEGFAQVLEGTPQHARYDEFETAQKQAITKEAGMWSYDLSEIRVDVGIGNRKAEDFSDDDVIYVPPSSKSSSNNYQGIVSLVVIILAIAGFIFALSMMKPQNKRCPMCEGLLPNNHKVCRDCGYNFETGYLGDAELQNWVTKNIKVRKSSGSKKRRKK